jgi:cellulose synthase/poly-beta-1,6-N-acetylglucosamine synthase-like glycosyltransferase
MSTRILAAGYKTRYAYDAITYTEGPSDWKGLCNQRLRWKFGRFQTFIKYKQLFFSLGKKRNPYFTCLLLPIALYAEFILLFQGFFLAIFYSYTIYTNDYLPLFFVILFMTLMILLQVIFDAKSRFHLNLLLLAPIAWIVLYAVDLVEFHALCRSLKCMIKQEELHWQKWVRVGLKGHTALPAESIIKEEDVFCNPES